MEVYTPKDEKVLYTFLKRVSTVPYVYYVFGLSGPSIIS
jgi:hypothetical protein